jgi:plastocyanin
MLTSRALAAVAFSLLAVTACGSDEVATTDPTTTANIPATTSADNPVDTSSAVDVVDTTDVDDATETPGAQSAVGLEGTRFDPADVDIAAGDTVTFTNNDPYSHTVTSADGSSIEFDSGEIGQGVTFEQTFETAGTYEIFCKIHPTMRATITVS